MDSKKRLLIIACALIIGCMIVGTSYFLIPLFASVINGSPRLLGMILAAIVVVVSIFVMFLIRDKKINIAIFIITAAVAGSAWPLQDGRFGSDTYFNNYINSHNGVYNKFGVKILSGYFIRGNLDGYGPVWYRSDNWHNSYALIKVYTINGDFLLEEKGEYTGDIMNRIGLHSIYHY